MRRTNLNEYLDDSDDGPDAAFIRIPPHVAYPPGQQGGAGYPAGGGDGNFLYPGLQPGGGYPGGGGGDYAAQGGGAYPPGQRDPGYAAQGGGDPGMFYPAGGGYPERPMPAQAAQPVRGPVQDPRPARLFIRGGGRGPVHLEPEYGNEVRDTGTKYVSSVLQRLKYRVEVGARLKRRTINLDTGTIKAHFNAKDRSVGTGRAELGQSPLMRGAPREIRQSWHSASMIWVCTEGHGGRAEFYSHVAKVYRFHHSSFMAGGDLIGAGEWIVEDGRLMKINGNSGHYKPSTDSLRTSLRHLAAAVHPGTMVTVWGVREQSWIEVEAFRFMNEPYAGWKAHPDSL